MPWYDKLQVCPKYVMSEVQNLTVEMRINDIGIEKSVKYSYFYRTFHLKTLLVRILLCGSVKVKGPAKPQSQSRRHSIHLPSTTDVSTNFQCHSLNLLNVRLFWGSSSLDYVLSNDIH